MQNRNGSTELLLILFFALQVLSVIGLSPLNGTSSESNTAYLKAEKFLTSYGYLPSRGFLSAKMRDPSLRKHLETERTNALKLFQSFYNLPETGKLDKETTQLMQTPRCGNVDITSSVIIMDTPEDLEMEEDEDVAQIRNETKKQDRDGSGVNMDRGRRSVDKSKKKKIKPMSGQRKDGILKRWRFDEMGWKITHASNQKHLPLDVQRNIVHKALSTWEPILPFKFVEKIKHRKADMNIMFHSFAKSTWNDKLHGENAWRKDEGIKSAMRKAYNTYISARTRLMDKLDREKKERKKERTAIKRPEKAPKRKGSHAHAMVPGNKEIMRQRDIHINEDYDWSNHDELLSVLLHEIGHSLGLGHTRNEKAVMYPYTRDVTQIALADIEGIEKLYGYKDGRLSRQKCDAKIREVDNIFRVREAQQGTWTNLFFVISGEKLEVSSPKSGVIRMYERYDMVFLYAPSKYDLVFSASSAKHNSVFFVDLKWPGTLYQYMEDKLTPTRTNIQTIFPQFPRVAVTYDAFRNKDGSNSTNTVFYGDDYSWTFEFRGREFRTSPPAYRDPQTLNEQGKQLVSQWKYAVQWMDGNIYVVTRNGSWMYYDFNKNNPSPTMKGPLPWIETLLCHGHAASIRVSRPSLVLVIILSLTKLY